MDLNIQLTKDKGNYRLKKGGYLSSWFWGGGIVAESQLPRGGVGRGQFSFVFLLSIALPKF